MKIQTLLVKGGNAPQHDHPFGLVDTNRITKLLVSYLKIGSFSEEKVNDVAIISLFHNL